VQQQRPRPATHHRSRRVGPVAHAVRLWTGNPVGSSTARPSTRVRPIVRPRIASFPPSRDPPPWRKARSATR
jgi:hypothetical protein